ncbi:hypothetical protein GCM10010082_00470 [Kushneria pakistanensis]|uniref:DUF1439 domain-containing protein n=1 Tax=Kushneria pakistanensis TaxID=1508770 RepID=A0ABQ3F910_9GAMM|nr:hypothetical protein [Kushneria pakistanensis]GHC14333.1 hypothetical protein GCM10010082_00470 [Kushneria pakistanensis]
MTSKVYRYRQSLLLAMTLSLAGCLALPQASFMLGRLALQSMGVENVRIGRWAVPVDALTLEPTALARAGLDMAGMPVSLDLPLSLTPPDAAPDVTLAGYAWQLVVPGAEPVSGDVDEPVTLRGGEPANLRLPVELFPEAPEREGASYNQALLALAQRLANHQQLPAGSTLSLTPRLDSEMARLIPAPTITLDIAGSAEQRSASGLPENAIPAVPVSSNNAAGVDTESSSGTAPGA